MSFWALSVAWAWEIEVITYDGLKVNGKQISKIFMKQYLHSNTWSLGLIVTYNT